MCLHRLYLEKNQDRCSQVEDIAEPLADNSTTEEESPQIGEMKGDLVEGPETLANLIRQKRDNGGNLIGRKHNNPVIHR